MNLRIVVEHGEHGSTFLIVDAGAPADEQPAIIDAYPTRAEAENFLQFIGQNQGDIP
jgi:hypothetical protein